MRFNLRELIYIPNLLTYQRLVLIPLILIYLREHNLLAASLLGGTAMLSDILDGVLARRLNESTELGKILDPLTDKIALAVFAIYAVWQADLPIWAAGLIIGRDILIIFLGIVYAQRVKEIPVSNFLGKITALSWGLLLLVYVVKWEKGQLPLMWLSLVLLLASVISYARRLFISIDSSTPA
jgi:CDP-diacylglycerol--glycerol-3-phosphate 3-phosphatidyltransferase